MINILSNKKIVCQKIITGERKIILQFMTGQWRPSEMRGNPMLRSNILSDEIQQFQVDSPHLPR